jgi:putative glutamine transport system substrate-binding protein
MIMDRALSEGRLVAGVSYDIPGMGYPNPRTGRIDGFETDLARALGEKLFGAPGHIELAQVTDDKRIEKLQQGQVDMVVSQLTISPDRAEQVDFSIPYWVTREGILVRKGSGIKGFDDLKGKRIAVTAGSISLRRMRATLPEDKLIVTTLGIDNFRAVEKGEADAASNDLIDLSMMLRQADHPDEYEVIDIGEHFDPKPFGVGVKKGRQSLIGRLNEAIDSLKASGEIERLMSENIARLAAPRDIGMAPTA